MQYDKLREKIIEIQNSIVDDDGDAYGLCDRTIALLNQMENNDRINLNYIIEELTKLSSFIERQKDK